MLLKDLVEKFNIAVDTAFNKGYAELEPQIAGLAYEFMSGDVSSTKFPITKIMSKIRKFTGNRKHMSPADAFYVSISNEEFDGAIDVPRRDLKRAMAANSITGLDMFVKEINALGSEAKETPYEDLLDLVEQGHTSTYGTTFDAQNFFDTTHAFDNKAGTQSNLLTGTGVTEAAITTDLLAAFSALRSFYYTMDSEDGGNKKKRKLNKTLAMTLICDDSLVEIFEKINGAEYLDGKTNNLKGRLANIVGRPLADANDWFIFEVSEANVKPFIISMEERPMVEAPSNYDYNLKEHKVLTWGIEGFSFGKGYGAWWKGIKTTNA